MDDLAGITEILTKQCSIGFPITSATLSESYVVTAAKLGILKRLTLWRNEAKSAMWGTGSRFYRRHIDLGDDL